MATRYDSLRSLQQGPLETEQAFMQRVIKESKFLLFCEKNRENLIKERLIESMTANMPALLDVSEDELTVMPHEDLLACLNEKHLSESSIAGRVAARVMGDRKNVASVV